MNRNFGADRFQSSYAPQLNKVLEQTNKHIFGLQQVNEKPANRDILQFYNNRLAEQFEQILSSKGFSVYPKDLISNYEENPEMGELFVCAERLSPLLKALDDENKLLKEEVTHLSKDLKRFISLVELLLEENNYLREHINQKNTDISQLIEKININDGEEINDLKNKIHLQTEENNTLIKHLDEMKRFRDNYGSFVQEKEDEIIKCRDVIDKQSEDLQQSVNQQELLNKQLSQIEPKYSRAATQVAQLEEKVSELSTQLNSEKNKNEILNTQCTLYKSQYEDINKKKADENDQLLQENNTLMNERKELKQLISQQEKSLIESNQQIQNLQRQFDTANQDLDQLTQLLNDFKGQGGQDKSKVNGALAREKSMREKVEYLENECQKQTLKAERLEQQYNSLFESARQENADKHQKYETIIEKFKIKYREETDLKEEEITDLKAKKVEQDRTIGQLHTEIDRKNNEIADLKKKMAELRESRGLLDKQSAQLTQVKNENRDLTNQLLEYKSLQGISLLSPGVNEKQQQQKYQQQLNRIYELELALNQEQAANNLLRQENQHLSNQIAEIKQEVRDYQDNYASAINAINNLKAERDNLFYKQAKERTSNSSSLPVRNVVSQEYTGRTGLVNDVYMGNLPKNKN